MEKFLKSVYLDRLQNALETQQRTKEEIVTCTQYAQKLMADNLPVLFEENHVYQVLKWKKSNQQQYHTFLSCSERKRTRNYCAKPGTETKATMDFGQYFDKVKNIRLCTWLCQKSID